jgi:predicted dehydrogenase
MTTLAFLGCAHIHTPGFIKAIGKRGGDVKVKSVWDHDAERAKKRAAELGASVVDDPKTILADDDIKAVVICSETDRHEQLVVPAAQAGKALFVEKPLGITARDADAMADAIEKAKVTFQTGYFMRGQPRLRFLRQKIADGAFGTITRLRGCNGHGGALGGWFDTEWRWMADVKRAGVGGFGDLGTHALDILLWWMGHGDNADGSKVENCTAAISNGTARYPECDELGEGIIRFKSGAIATLAASWDDVANPMTFQIAGTEGHAAIFNDQLYFQSKHEAGSDIKKPWAKELPETKPAGFEAFLDAVSGKPAELVGVREAAARTAVMEALYQSARRRSGV